MLTYQELIEHLSYDPTTGIFIRIKQTKKFKTGAILGTLHSTGYIVIRIHDKLYKAHRLAWLFSYKEFPSLNIDHINRNRSDNRLENLRMLTQKQNSENQTLHKNNTSGHPGVDWCKKLQKWRARITVNYVGKHIGFFLDKNEAISAYKKHAVLLHTHNSFAWTKGFYLQNK